MNTIQQKETKPLPPLIKGSSTYKLLVPQKVEEKIRYLIRKFPHTEWSGVLFYTHQGTFEDNNLIITCEDIYPMDLGNAVYTEFKMSEDVAAYMAENIELFDCETSLVHSHHTMSTQFSGTDMQTLQIEGNDTNCFVSLIVNTAGTYSAKVTRKVQTKSEVTIKKLGTSYEFFGEGSKELTHDSSETTKTVDKEVIEYFDLEVERQEVPNTLGYLDDRFEEIEKKKQSSRVIQSKDSYPGIGDNPQFLDYLHRIRKSNQEPEEFDLFGNREANTSKLNKKDYGKLNNTTVDWQPDPKKIHEAAVHLVTLNLIINPDKIDFKQWVTRHMVNMYKKVFGESSMIECKLNSCGAFTEYKDFMIQFILDYFNYDTVPDELMENDFNYVQGIVAQSLIDEIFEYVEGNPYMKAYYEELSQYIV